MREVWPGGEGGGGGDRREDGGGYNKEAMQGGKMGKTGFKRFGRGGAAIAALNSCSELLAWLTVCMPSLAFPFGKKIKALLLPPQNPKFFKIPRHIEFLDTYIKY